MLPNVSIIMPAYNERLKIAESIRAVQANLENLTNPYEIIIVDDGSEDGTRDQALRAASNPHVKVVGYQQNKGKGFAIKFGAGYAKGDVVVLIDSDAEINPDLIQRYVAILERYDLAIASKRHPDSRVTAPVLRTLQSHAFHALVMLLTGITVSDTQSGFKAFRRDALVSITRLASVKHYAFDVEMLAIATMLKMNIAELPVRIELTQQFSFGKILRMFIDLLGITYRLRLIHWYQKNVNNMHATYSPILKW